MAAIESIRCDVAIVGGGPVGMGLAIDLGQRGVHCVVVERHEKPQKVPKGQNLTQRTLEHFRAWGVEDAIRRARIIPRELGIRGLTTYGNLLSDYHYDWFQRDKVAEFYFCENERLPQYKTEEVLRQRASELPLVTAFYSNDCTKVIDIGDEVHVEIQNRNNSTSRQVIADYCVGCDGSQSVVRNCAGIEQDKDNHDKRMVLLVFKSPELHTLLECYPGKSYFNVINPALDGYWQFFGRVDYGETFFFHAPVSAEVSRDNHDFHRMLCDIVGQDIAITFEHIGFWDLRIATVKQYQAGRLFVAGDAAHSHPPYGGFGINTGFEDARNLGWKLSAVLDGWAGDSLLSTYNDERRPVFQSTAKDFINRYIESDREFINQFDPTRDKQAFESAWLERSQGSDFDVVGFAPHYSGSPLINAPDDKRITSGANSNHEKRARAGHHLTPLMLEESVNVYDKLGNGFTLLFTSAETATAEQIALLASRFGVPLELVEDIHGDAMRIYQATLLLVRPDQFVGWVKPV